MKTVLLYGGPYHGEYVTVEDNVWTVKIAVAKEPFKLTWDDPTPDAIVPYKEKEYKISRLAIRYEKDGPLDYYYVGTLNPIAGQKFMHELHCLFYFMKSRFI